MSNSKTLRLHFPQWQGGNNEAYHFGSQMLAFLAPEPNGPVEEVPVSSPEGIELSEEKGLKGRTQLLEQLHSAKSIIEKHQPDSIVVLGGDCLVDLAPFNYLNEKYEGELGIIWVDAHPDIMTPEYYNHAHAMVLGNLLGIGDDDFKSVVNKPVKPENVLFAGLGPTLDYETDFIQKNNMAFVKPEELSENSKPVTDWIKAKGITKVAIHLDLDVMSIADFGSLYFAERDVPADKFEGLTQGAMKLTAVQRLVNDIGDTIEVVGLGVTEHLPWDALRLKNMLASFPLLGK
ncbi:arginase family protein [Vibrio sp.]|uniref:Arginase family protein n=1 Tax=Vibrio viridaestus TaxID=2487322 RepID=A0A3N9U4T8_9VIBR|nr:arginase family protein [Vibrio viridaestus]MDC0609803.1 arginase family protein [Vibrio sp.]RQW64682.1 arginase family protein [Vibrio viridaestus]